MKFRNNKLFKILILILLLFISIGYAFLNSTLTITGKSNVRKNIWDVHFENIMVTKGSVTASVEPIISNNTTISNFELTLDKPGDFYEFYVDVKNSGTIDAMIDSVVKRPDLTEEQKKYINYVVSYQNGEEVIKKQLVNSGEYVRIKVKVEYKKDLNSSDLPIVAETLTLGLDINYVQADDTGIIVPGRSLTKIVSGDGTKTGDEICIGEECFYVMYSDDTTITMLSKYNLYVGGEYDDSTWTAYGDEATGKQDLNMTGYGKTPRKGTTKFSNTHYWTNTVSSYPSYVYDSNSTLYSYVENYKTYLSTLGVTPIEARLITQEELEGLGCGDSSCKTAPSWVYATSYWVGSANSSFDIWYVDSYGRFRVDAYSIDHFYGCRPVIVIPKSDIAESSKKLIEFSIGSVNYQAEEGMTWEEWIDSVYSADIKFFTVSGSDRVYYFDGGSPSPYLVTGNSQEIAVSFTDKIIANTNYYISLGDFED